MHPDTPGASAASASSPLLLHHSLLLLTQACECSPPHSPPSDHSLASPASHLFPLDDDIVTDLMDPLPSSSKAAPPPLSLSPKARPAVHALTSISPLASPLPASPLSLPPNPLTQAHGRHHSHHAPRRKAHSAWSSRSSSPSRAGPPSASASGSGTGAAFGFGFGFAGGSGSGGGGGGGRPGTTYDPSEPPGLANRPRSKSTASLSAYFGTPTSASHSASASASYSAHAHGQPLSPYDVAGLAMESPASSALFGFPDPRLDVEDADAHALFGAPVGGMGQSVAYGAAGFPRVRSLTDMPTLSSFSHAHAYARPPSYAHAVFPPDAAAAAAAAAAAIANGSTPAPVPGLGQEADPPPVLMTRKEAWRAGLEDVDLRLLNRAGVRRGRIKTVRSDTETETEPLPTARIPPPKTDKPPLARRLVPLFMFFCRGLSLVPAVLGSGWHLYLAYRTPWRFLGFGAGTAGGEADAPSGVDHAIASLWSVGTGIWCYLLASGLLRRWLTYYPLFPTLIRQLSLQAICWSSTHLTLRFFGPARPLTAWVIIGTTTSISHSVQIWVTSNIRLARTDAARESKRWFAVGMGLDYWLGKRKIDWGKVVRQSLVPLFALYFVTCWALLVDREMFGRGG